MTAAIEVTGLRKSFRRIGRPPAEGLVSVDLEVQDAEIHGFLGPNGAGKTTTLRILTGLAGADAGVVRVLGEPVPEALLRVVPRMGAVIESPRFASDLTAKQHLELLAISGGQPVPRCGEVLDLVAMREHEQRRIGEFSLGMRQRLAIAAALLRSPSVLLLDEPMNGLDPAGMRDVKDLLIGLASSGVAVLLSSHNLADVEQICHRITVINRGRTVARGSVADVVSAFAEPHVVVTVKEHQRGKARRRLLRAGYRVEEGPGGELLVLGECRPEELGPALAAADIWPTALSVGHTLEDAFLAMTAEDTQ
jgi:ABC-2 type transport system ATP-binding protein